jgi:predicted MFS family arabinose efflux permease
VAVSRATGLPPYLVPLLALMALHTTAIASLLAPPIFAVAAVDELGLSIEWIGAYPFLVYGAAILSATFVGGLTANVGPIRASQYCLFLVGAGVCLFASADLWLMVLGSLIVGAGYGPLTAAGSDLLKHVTPQRLQPVIFSVKQTAIPIGGALAGASIPTLVNLTGWRGTAVLLGVICIGLTLFAQTLQARLDGGLPRSSDRSLLGFGSLRLVARNPAYLLLGVAALCFAFAQGVLFTYLVPYLSDELGLTLVVAGAVLAAAQLGGAGARILWGAVASWLNSAKSVLIGLGAAMAVAAAATALFDPDWSLAAIVAVSILFGMTAVGWNGVFLAEVAHVAPPGGVGALTGTMSSLAFFGLMTGPPVFGVLIKATQGYFSGFMAVAAMTLIGSALLLRMPGKA